MAFHDWFTSGSLSMPEWSRASRNKKEKKAQHAAPDPMQGGGDNNPYVQPHPRGRVAPYVPANFDYAEGPEYNFGTVGNYDVAINGRTEWVNDVDPSYPDEVLPPGTYPAAGYDPDEWHGYRMEDWKSSQRNEHVINADEGLPMFGQKRYHPALNPYWNKIPNTRPQRQPHEYDFRRKYDQWSKRNLSGEVYAAGNIGLTSNPSQSLKGMAPQRHRKSTRRVEPIEAGENIYSTGPMPTSGTAVFASGMGALGPGYAVS